MSRLLWASLNVHGESNRIVLVAVLVGVLDTLKLWSNFTAQPGLTRHWQWQEHHDLHKSYGGTERELDIKTLVSRDM